MAFRTILCAYWNRLGCAPPGVPLRVSPPVMIAPVAHQSEVLYNHALLRAAEREFVFAQRHLPQPRRRRRLTPRLQHTKAPPVTQAFSHITLPGVYNTLLCFVYTRAASRRSPDATHHRLRCLSPCGALYAASFWTNSSLANNDAAREHSTAGDSTCVTRHRWHRRDAAAAAYCLATTWRRLRYYAYNARFATIRVSRDKR